MHHVRAGSGPPLVLFAGLGMDCSAWRPVEPLLAPERDVWAIDLPGFGRTEALADGEPCGVEALADAVEEFLAGSGLERPHVAGNSLGGALALELAHRGSVASATALSPAGFTGRLSGHYAAKSLRLSHALARSRHDTLVRLAARPRARRLLWGQNFARPERLPPAQAVAYMDTMLASPAFHRVLEELEEHEVHAPLRAPTTIAWGTRDALLLPTQALRARRRFPEARHVWLSGCGHVPMSDDPEQVARVLLEGSRPSEPSGPAALALARARESRRALLRRPSRARTGRPRAPRAGAAGRPASRASSR